jgi:hypothetical protein
MHSQIVSSLGRQGRGSRSCRHVQGQPARGQSIPCVKQNQTSSIVREPGSENIKITYLDHALNCVAHMHQFKKVDQGGDKGPVDLLTVFYADVRLRLVFCHLI